MASMFTSMLYWMDGKLATVQDVPSDPIYTFTKGNVLSGQFNYETTARTTRFNQITVTYNAVSYTHLTLPTSDLV